MSHSLATKSLKHGNIKNSQILSNKAVIEISGDCIIRDYQCIFTKVYKRYTWSLDIELFFSLLEFPQSHIYTLPVGHAFTMITMNSTAPHEHQLTNKNSTLLVNNILNGHPCSLTSKMTQHSSTLNNAAVCNYHYDIE